MKRLLRSVALVGVLAAGVWFGIHTLPQWSAGVSGTHYAPMSGPVSHP